MAAYNGFGTVAPDAKYGATGIGQSANYAMAQKYVLGGSGTQELTEIGFYGHGNGSAPSVIMGVFTHDAANDCPEALVADSQIAIAPSGSSYVLTTATYSTKPQLTSGDTYWMALLANGEVYVSGESTSGELERTATYDTWPTSTAWHTHSHFNYDLSFYAVYQASSGGATASMGPRAAYVARLRG